MANLNEKTKFICGRNPLAKNNRPSFAHAEQEQAALWLTGGEVNTERMAHVLLDEFREGKLGRMTLERP